MKVIDGKNAILGRLASFAAKTALRGEEIIIVNCNKIIISGSEQNIKQKWNEKKEKIGSTQKGPKHSVLCEKLVKRSIRNMLPNHRSGRGKEALKKIKCYKDLPEKLKDTKRIEMPSIKNKSISVGEISK